MLSLAMNLLAADQGASDFTVWMVAGLIVLLGLGIFGWKDLSQLKWRRLWAP